MSGDFPKKVLALVAPGQKSVLKRLVNQLGDKHSFEFVFLETAEDATKAIRDCPYGLFICEVENKKSLALSVSVLKRNRRILRETHIKVGSFNHLKNPNVEKGLKKVGVDDFFDIYINPKSFSFKLEFWFKTLKPLAQAESGSEDVRLFSNNQPGVEGATEVQVGANGVGKSGVDKSSLKRKRNEVVKVAHIENENDMWLTTSKDDCKNVLRRWLVKLVGPSANVGRWEQEVLKSNRAQTVWKFIFFNEKMKEMFVEDDGNWCFDGGKPEFDWEEKKWIFTGATPSLFFEGDSDNFDYRFKYDQGALCLAENSVYAETKKEFIEKTFEDTQTFDQDAQEAESESNVKDNLNEIDKNMKGDVSGDSQVGGHIQGQSSAGNDEGGHLEGASSSGSEIDGHMQGASKDTSDVGGHMHGATEDNSDKGGSIGGRSEYQEETHGNTDGNIEGTDDLGKGHYSNQESTGHGQSSDGQMGGTTSRAADRSGGPMGGRSDYREDAQSDIGGNTDGTDDLGPEHYSNQNSFQENKKGANRGKTGGTDDLGPDKYSNQQNHKEVAAKGLGGKQKGSDQLGPNHYSNESLYSEDAQDDMSGEVDRTDNLGKKHYSNRESTTSQEYGANGPMSGKKKGDENQGETHYSNQGNKAKGDGENNQDDSGKLIGKKIEKNTANYEGEIGASATSAKNKNQEVGTEDYLAEHKAKKSREKAEAEASYSEDDDYAARTKGDVKENQLELDGNKRPERDRRDEKMADMEDILSDKKYKESEFSESESKDEEESALAKENKKGYDFESGEAESKDGIYDDFEPSESGEKAPVRDIEPAESELRQIIAQSEIKIIVELKDDETTKRMATFEDMYEPELILGIPKGVFKANDDVSTYMLIKYLDQKVSMTISGKVLEVEESDEENEIIIIEVDNFNDDRLKQFMDIYQQRQANIQKFMDLAKGVA